MPETWKRILADSHPQWNENGGLDGFGDPETEQLALEQQNFVCPLPGMGLIWVAGADAQEFLQNQLTAEVGTLAEDEWTFAGYCNPKGRLLALFKVLRFNEGYLLVLPRTLVESVVQRLRMFVLRSQVALEDLSEDYVLFGGIGGPAQTLLEETAGTLPGSGRGVARAGDLIVLRIGDLPEGFLTVAPAGEAATIWESLARRITPVGPSSWALVDIRNGLPQVYSETREAFVPQMVNLDLVDGVSFQKGCYPGQEIVARMRYLGTLKRRMFRIAGHGAPPVPGEDVRNTDGTKLGTVADSAPIERNDWEALAVLQIERGDDAPLIDGAPVEVLPLPYEVDSS